MAKKTKIWLIIASFLVVFGFLLFIAVMMKNDWDFATLSTEKFETNNHEISDDFSSISIKTSTADINFVPSEDGKCRVVCYEAANAKHTVVVEDNILTINENNDKKWYEYIGIFTLSPKITVYFTKAEYNSLKIDGDTGDIDIPKDFSFEVIDISVDTADVKNYASAKESVKISTSTGDIVLKDISANKIDLAVSTGDIECESITCGEEISLIVSTGKSKLTDISCNSFKSFGSTGDIILKNVIATKTLRIGRGTGDVRFEGCDSPKIFVCTDTGDVTGTLLSEMVFITNTDTGRVEVPKSVTGGKCEIVTDTGDIIIK